MATAAARNRNFLSSIDDSLFEECKRLEGFGIGNRPSPEPHGHPDQDEGHDDECDRDDHHRARAALIGHSRGVEIRKNCLREEVAHSEDWQGECRHASSLTVEWTIPNQRLNIDLEILRQSTV